MPFQPVRGAGTVERGGIDLWTDRRRGRRGSGESGTGEKSMPDRLFPHSFPSVMGFSPVFRLMLQRRSPVSRRGGTG